MTTLDELKRYEYAPIGMEFLQFGDLRGAKSSLDKILDGLSMTPDVREMIGEMANAEGVESALKYSFKKHSDFEKDATFDTFWQLYQDGYSKDGEKKVFGLLMGRYGAKKLKEVQDELKDKKDQMKDVLDNNTPLADADILNLADDITRYTQALNIFGVSRDIRLNSLRGQAYNNARTQEGKDLNKKARSVVGI